MNTAGWVVALVVVIIIAGGAWWYTSNQTNTQAPATTTEQGSAAGTVPSGSGSDAGMQDNGVVGGDASAGVGTPKTVTVSYNGNAFSPQAVTVKKGDTVNFVASGAQFWVAADDHPTHAKYDGTNRGAHCAAGYSGAAAFDACASGTSYSFTFGKTGSFDYHNHLNATQGGRVVVE